MTGAATSQAVSAIKKIGENQKLTSGLFPLSGEDLDDFRIAFALRGLILAGPL